MTRDSGQKITFGLDDNGNTILDAVEVDSTSFVCNGLDGSSSAGTATQHYSSIYSSDYSSAIHPCGGTLSKTKIEYYTLGKIGLELPYKSCISESCTEDIANGRKYENFSSCDDGSQDSDIETLYCDSGSVNIIGNCVKISNYFSKESDCIFYGYTWFNDQCTTSCPSGHIKTSGGCTSCLFNETVIDNKCISINYIEITGDICGIYNNPVTIKSGNHVVTCDVAFKNNVYIEAGTNFNVDNYYTITFESSINFDGRSDAHIIFDKSINSLSTSWKSFQVKGGEVLYNYSKGYISGNKINFLDVNNVDNVTVNNSYMSNSSINIKGNIGLSNIYSYKNIYNGSNLAAKINYNYYGYNDVNLYNYFINDNMNLSNSTTANSLYKSLVLWSSINAPYLDDKSSIFYSTINSKPYCSGVDSYLIGNKFVGFSSVPTNCNLINNSTTTISTIPSIYILNDSENTLSEGQSEIFSVYFLDHQNWITDATVGWSLVSDYEGGVILSTPFSGYSILVNNAATPKESYKLRIDTVNGGAPVGKTSVNLQVW